MMVDNVYILDNGAHTAKVELSKAAAPRIIPNCIMKAKSERRRPFIADQVDECRDASGLFYLLPFQKGFLVNWDVQKTVWDHLFSKECCYGNFSETPLIVTEPYFNFPSIQEAMSEIFFEEYDCQSLLRINVNCVVKEELERLLETLQLRNTSADNLAIVESASYVLRYISNRCTHEDELQAILWEKNHNPLLRQSLYSDYSIECKKLWTRNICNLQDEQLLLELIIVPTLHSCLHVKQRNQMFLSNLADFCFVDYLVEHEENGQYDTNRRSTLECNSISESHMSQNNISEISGEKSPEKSKCLMERIASEEYCDSNYQPVNYSLKYFEYEIPSMLDNPEQPVNFSLKYLEELEGETSTGVDTAMFGAGETCYAETDLDEPSDVIFNYLEREDVNHCSEGPNFGSLKTYPLSFSEELKNYHDEGTPCDFSTATSLSGICSPILGVDDGKVETGKQSPSVEDLNQVKNEGMVLETPLMFSRCSSVSSLTSVEPLDDVRSVISDYSRMASGMISPSDLPDSPTQTSAPSLHSFKLHAPLKQKSVFEEKVSIFREESTPIQFSTTSSLSALSFDDNQLETPGDLKFHNQSLATSEAVSTDGGGDDDILAACIRAGMQNGKNKRSDKVQYGKQYESQSKVNEFSSSTKTLRRDKTRVSLEQTSFAKTEEIGSNIMNLSSSEDLLSHTSHSTTNSDLSKIPEDSEHIDILAECIQAGMPKASGKSKSNVKKSVKMSVKLPSLKELSLADHEIQNSCGHSGIPNTRKNVLHSLKTVSTHNTESHGRNILIPESHSRNHFIAQVTGKSPLNSPLEPNTEQVQLSRRSSIESLKEDLSEDPVTLSELLLLEQCISSAMPKKKIR